MTAESPLSSMQSDMHCSRVTRLHPACKLEDFHRQRGSRPANLHPLQAERVTTTKAAFGSTSYDDSDVSLFVTWTAKKLNTTCHTEVDRRLGTQRIDGAGPSLSRQSGELLSGPICGRCATLSADLARRGSRLSQILANVPGIERRAIQNDSVTRRGCSEPLEPSRLPTTPASEEPPRSAALKTINTEYLAALSHGRQSSRQNRHYDGGTEPMRLRQILSA